MRIALWTLIAAFLSPLPASFGMGCGDEAGVLRSPSLETLVDDVLAAIRTQETEAIHSRDLEKWIRAKCWLEVNQVGRDVLKRYLKNLQIWTLEDFLKNDLFADVSKKRARVIRELYQTVKHAPLRRGFVGFAIRSGEDWMPYDILALVTVPVRLPVGGELNASEIEPVLIYFKPLQPCTVTACRELHETSHRGASEFVEYFDGEKAGHDFRLALSSGTSIVHFASADTQTTRRDPSTYIFAGLLGYFSNEIDRLTVPISLVEDRTPP